MAEPDERVTWDGLSREELLDRIIKATGAQVSSEMPPVGATKVGVHVVELQDKVPGSIDKAVDLASEQLARSFGGPAADVTVHRQLTDRWTDEQAKQRVVEDGAHGSAIWLETGGWYQHFWAVVSVVES